MHIKIFSNISPTMAKDPLFTAMFDTAAAAYSKPLCHASSGLENVQAEMIDNGQGRTISWLVSTLALDGICHEEQDGTAAYLHRAIEAHMQVWSTLHGRLMPRYPNGGLDWGAAHRTVVSAISAPLQVESWQLNLLISPQSGICLNGSRYPFAEGVLAKPENEDKEAAHLRPLNLASGEAEVLVHLPLNAVEFHGVQQVPTDIVADIRAAQTQVTATLAQVESFLNT